MDVGDYMLVRLDKHLVEASVASRSQVKELIKKGRISVNGNNKLKPEQKIDNEKDKVFFDGKEIILKRYEYFMLNKPAGVISASRDKKAKTVVDLIKDKTRADLFPIGRLDKDTHGLLIISNDGDLAHKMLSPKKHVEKTYFLKARGIINKEAIKLFNEGVVLKDSSKEDGFFKTLPAKLEILETRKESLDYLEEDSREMMHFEGKLTLCRITIKEGKYHQIKKMFKSIDSEVLYLQRISMGNLVLDPELKEGDYRELTDKELEDLKRLF